MAKIAKALKYSMHAVHAEAQNTAFEVNQGEGCSSNLGRQVLGNEWSFGMQAPGIGFRISILNASKFV